MKGRIIVGGSGLGLVNETFYWGLLCLPQFNASNQIVLIPSPPFVFRQFAANSEEMETSTS